MTKKKTKSRSKAIFINGGAGRMLAAIPALERHIKDDPNAIIVCEGVDVFFKNNPILFKSTFHPMHKNLFETYIKERDILSPEPYRIWEYFNQKCSIAQGFDSEINGSMSSNIIDYKPNIYLSNTEISKGKKVIERLREASGFSNFVVIQPFGAGAQVTDTLIHDDGGRSMEYNDLVKLIQVLSTNGQAVILMSSIDIQLPDDLKVGRPTADLREWVSIIKASNHFIGCDSVGQHIAYATNTPSTVILGGTDPINVSYPGVENVKIIDLGEGKREYSALRIAHTEDTDLHNSDLMRMSDDIINEIAASVSSSTGIVELLPPQTTDAYSTSCNHTHN